MLNMNEINLKNKRVLIRLDLNVPIHNGKIQSYARIDAALPTIKMAVKAHAKVILMSHLGQPKEGIFEKNFSLKPIFKELVKRLPNVSLFFKKNIEDINKINSGEIILLENVRFNIGETNNCKTLSKKYSEICDIFIMDAFGSAHRIHASTYGVAKYSSIKCAGPLLLKEICALEKVLNQPKRPMVAIVGGAKISTKFNILYALEKIADIIIVGGGIANTFIAVNNSVGKSLHEPEYIEEAKKILERKKIIAPIDSRVSTSFNKEAVAYIKSTNNIHINEEIMDIGTKTEKIIKKIILNAKTILWNGPVGVFEFPNFSSGTKNLAMAIAESNGFSVAGGGDTINAIEKFQIKNKISYISTGGGSFLTFLEKSTLPCIDILK
ncbi:phosphoglycerate kinase [Buchnera aphidicola (Thelaxes californica)]|uniref:Phosphoglycerate kinase n=1 Tax=Buchnera aphidicola (Thelaxes californica) TaxID=1315998 RepID=A0A4D6YBX7_9GAMM|nr:phosphoglycerate kinase [Buchnera aphidicola]QCI26869.1 phosphoglycerate kinase [Buchnera aphidicola (Thelaxes californica)]